MVLYEVFCKPIKWSNLSAGDIVIHDAWINPRFYKITDKFDYHNWKCRLLPIPNEDIDPTTYNFPNESNKGCYWKVDFDLLVNNLPENTIVYASS